MSQQQDCTIKDEYNTYQAKYLLIYIYNSIMNENGGKVQAGKFIEPPNLCSIIKYGTIKQEDG